MRTFHPFLRALLRLARSFGAVVRPNRGGVTQGHRQEVDLQLDDIAGSWDTNNFRLEVQVNRPSFKFANSGVIFGSVFSGSNDRGAVAQEERILEYLRKVSERSPVSLISVIGGAYFLDLVFQVNLRRVVLFDINIAEFTKLSSLLNLAEKDPSVDPIPVLEQMYISDPSSLMPRGPMSEVTWRAGPKARWSFEGRSNPSFPWILPSSSYPEYKWSSTQETRERVLSQLKGSLVKSAFLEFPRVDAGGDLVVVFASNISSKDLKDNFIKSRILNSSGVIVVRASVSDNVEALDPHPFWEATARSLLFGKSHQIWLTSSRALISGPYDKLTTTSSLVGEPIPEGTVCVITHLLLGKSSDNPQKARKYFENQIWALPDFVERVVVAEFADASLGNAGFESAEELESYLRATLQQFVMSESITAPGEQSLERNRFFVFNRRD